jgi:hypothetical protein
VVVHTCNANIQEAEAGRLQIPGTVEILPQKEKERKKMQ